MVPFMRTELLKTIGRHKDGLLYQNITTTYRCGGHYETAMLQTQLPGPDDRSGAVSICWYSFGNSWGERDGLRGNCAGQISICALHSCQVLYQFEWGLVLWLYHGGFPR